MKSSKIASLLALLFAFALVAAACGSDDPVANADDSAETDGVATDDGEEPSDDGEEPSDDATDDGGSEEAFSVSQGIVEPSFIDSFNVQDSEGFQVARLVYDGLTDFDSNLEAIPAVAESWEHEDFTVWTFNLKPGTLFHNGETVTAQSFINGFTYLADPEAASDVSYYGGYVAGIEGFDAVLEGEATEITGLAAPDENTLVITLSGPNALLPAIIAHPAFSPRSEAAMADAAASLESPIGNGPYQMASPWEHNLLISLERFEDYYGTAGNAATVDFRIFDSIDTMYLEAQAGTLDISDVPPEQITAAATDFGDRNIQVAIGAYNYLGFPVDQAPFDNADIRKALSLAIDREAIAEEIFSGARLPADGFYPDLAAGGTPGICTNCTYDVEAAQALYEAAGGIPGDQVTVYFNSGGGHEEWIQAVSNNWNQAFGLEAEFVGQEFAPYLDLVQGGDIDGPFRLGWGWDYPHAAGFLDPLFSSQSGDNLTGFANDDYDAALAEFRGLDDPVGTEAVALIAQMSEILNEEMPLIPIFFSQGQIVHTERIGDVNLTAFDFVEIEKVTLN